MRQRHRRPAVGWLVCAVTAIFATGALADCGPPPQSDAEILARPDIAAAVRQARETMPHAEGQVFEIATDPPSHLIGTVHIPSGGVEVPSKLMRAVVADARVLFLEVDSAALNDEMLAIANDPSRLFRPDGRRLSDRLSDAQKDAAERLLANYGIPLDVADRMLPVFLAALLAVPPCAVALAEQPGLDARLEALARAADVPVRSLETVDEQMALLTGDVELMEDQLILIIEQADRILPAWFERHTLYRQGRFAATWLHGVSELAQTVGAQEAATIAERIWKRWVADRNRRMMQRALPSLAEGGVVIAVGALHLPGKDGLVALLADEGYGVQRLDGPELATDQAPL